LRRCSQRMARQFRRIAAETTLHLVNRPKSRRQINCGDLQVKATLEVFIARRRAVALLFVDAEKRDRYWILHLTCQEKLLTLRIVLVLSHMTMGSIKSNCHQCTTL